MAAMPALEKVTAAMPADEVLSWQQTWARVRPLFITAAGQYEWAPGALTAAGARDLLLRHLSQSARGSNALPNGLQGEMERARALLQVITGNAIPGIVIRQFTPPQQTLRRIVAPDFDVAKRVSARLDEFLAGRLSGEKDLPPDHVCLAGLFALLLVVECGVLNRFELKAALEAIYQPQSVRACRKTYYLWLPDIRGRKSRSIGSRRLFLTRRAVVIALALNPDGVQVPDLNDAIRRACAQIGVPRSEVPSVGALMQGVATRLRLTSKVPQFVVDYAQARTVSHAVPEATWRRLVGLEPWGKSDLPDGSRPGPDAGDVTETNGPEIQREERGYLTSARSILRATDDSRKAAERLIALRESREAVSPLDALLLDWTIFLLGEKLSTGKPRRIGSVRTMVNALGPRLMAALVETPLSSLTEDDWQLALEQMLDAELSSSWNGTIQTSLANFLAWAQRGGHIGEIPESLRSQRKASAVHATLLTPEEFERLIARLRDPTSTEPEVDRRFQEFIARFGFAYSFRKGESQGLLVKEVNFDTGSTVDVVHNAGRSLKTDSSQRRIPIGLNDHYGFDDDLRSHIQSGEPYERIAAAFRTTASEDTLLRRLSKHLSAAADDDDVSIHTLRHSAATWLLVMLYADDLQLSRFVEDWPFLSSLLSAGARSRKILMGKRGSMHRLHAVRGILGHRNEEMSLLHYIHALDWLRFGAVTLRTEDDVEAVRSAHLAATGSRLRSAGLDRVMANIERKYPLRVNRNDTLRSAAAPKSSGRKSSGAEVVTRWIRHLNRIRDKDPGFPVDALSLHSRIVGLINAKRAVPKVRPPNPGITSLWEITPTSPEDRVLCQAIGQWAENHGPGTAKVSSAAMLLLESLDTRHLGRFGVPIGSASSLLRVVGGLTVAANIKFDLSVEIRKRLEDGRQQRLEIEISTLVEARALKASRVFLRPRLASATEVRKTLPLTAFIWALAMLALEA